MNDFEKNYRKKITRNTKELTNQETVNAISNINEKDEIKYTKTLISTLKEKTLDERIKEIFIRSACHIPHEKLENARIIYQETNSLKQAHAVLLSDFKKDIKIYKNLTDQQVEDIINRGWGLAGILKDDKITVTKIASMFHEYFKEENPISKKYYYCHCPRVRKELLGKSDIDSIYCNCGGGFYVDVWEYITGHTFNIKMTSNLFDGADVCTFELFI